MRVLSKERRVIIGLVVLQNITYLGLVLPFLILADLHGSDIVSSFMCIPTFFIVVFNFSEIKRLACNELSQTAVFIWRPIELVLDSTFFIIYCLSLRPYYDHTYLIIACTFLGVAIALNLTIIILYINISRHGSIRCCPSVPNQPVQHSASFLSPSAPFDESQRNTSRPQTLIIPAIPQTLIIPAIPTVPTTTPGTLSQSIEN